MIETKSVVEFKNDAQIAGRVPQKDRDFVYSLIDKEKGDTFATALSKLIEAYKSKPLENCDLDFSKEFNSMKNTVDSINKIIEGINARTHLYIDKKNNEVNEILDAKDMALKEAEKEYLLYVENVNAEKENLHEEIKNLKNEVSTLINDNESKEKYINFLEIETNHKNNFIENLEIEKNKLMKDVTEHTEKSIELQAKINNLMHLEKENNALIKELAMLKTEISIKDNTIANKENEIIKLNKHNNSLTEEVNSLNIEFNTLKDDISNLKLKHKEDIIDIKEKIKEDYEKKYEKIIEDYKDKLYNLNKQITELTNLN